MIADLTICKVHATLLWRLYSAFLSFPVCRDFPGQVTGTTCPYHSMKPLPLLTALLLCCCLLLFYGTVLHYVQLPWHSVKFEACQLSRHSFTDPDLGCRTHTAAAARPCCCTVAAGSTRTALQLATVLPGVPSLNYSALSCRTRWTQSTTC